MLTRYVCQNGILQSLKSGPAGPFLEGFIEFLEGKKLAYRTIRNYVGSLSHFSRWATKRGLSDVGSVSEDDIEALQAHVGACSCFGREHGQSDRLVHRVRFFLEFLRGTGVAIAAPAPHADPAILEAFRLWMVQCRGVGQRSLRTYSSPLRRLIEAFGQDPRQYTIEGVRTFLEEYRNDHRNPKTIETATVAVRMFLRFLMAEGHCAAKFEMKVFGQPRRVDSCQGPLLPLLDGFLENLRSQGLAEETVLSYCRSVSRFSFWAETRDLALDQLGEEEVEAFREGLTASRRSRPLEAAPGWTVSTCHIHRCLEYLRWQGIGVAARPRPTPPSPLDPTLVRDFAEWMRQHRGLAEATLDTYSRSLRELVERLGDEPHHYKAAPLREFLLDYQNRHGCASAHKAVTAMRVFLRYLGATGQCSVGLDAAIPSVAQWQLSSLPRYLPAEDVERVLAACEPSTATGLRDRAVLLLLARLGLRAGDVWQLRMRDIDWQNATLRLCGKARREALLPLTQEVGDAVLAYWQHERPRVPFEQLFLRVRPSIRPWTTSSSVSSIATKYIKRAGIVTPSRGAHVLRHSAATQMLRQGASLEEIGAILRHRSTDITAHYAKVDVELLKLVAQPWPEVTSC